MIVWQEGAVVELDDQGRLNLECWTPYVLEADANTELELPLALRPEALPRREGEPHRYRVNFGDCVGRLLLDGTDVLVSSAKLDNEGFDALLRQITSRVAELPFDFGTPTFVPFAREALDGRDLLYHAFLYLRWAAWYHRPSLTELWASITANPHRQLVREEHRVAFWEARSVSPRMLENIAVDCSAWYPVPGKSGPAVTPLARALAVDGAPHLPLTVTEPRVRSQVDTPENRFVKYVLEFVADLTDRAAAVFASRPCDTTLRRDASELAQHLRAMASSDWLSEVGELQRFPAHSQVMQKRFGYREMLGHYLALVLASRYPLAAADITRIVETKSASTLYEYWTFFELAETLGDLLGRPTEAIKTTEANPFSSSLREGIKLTFPPARPGLPVELWYNRTFSRGQWPAAPSYSVPLRPDITLRLGDELHLFDAKFRVDTFEPSVDEAITEEDADAGGTVTRGWFKRADIHKMHAYRDAIGGGSQKVASVWVLYPGTEFRFFGEDGAKLETATALAQGLRGVGAIPMKPQTEPTGSDHQRVLRLIVGR